MKITGLESISVMSIAVACFPGSAYCYIDLGSGSIMLQLLIAGIVGGLFAIKLFLKRIVAAVRKLLGKDAAGPPD